MIDSQARQGLDDQLVRDNLDLAHRVVAQFAARLPNHLHHDLLSAAMAGLADAARRYDTDRGVPFQAYALQRIRGSILDEMRANDWAGRRLRTKGRRMDRLAESMTAKLGRYPTAAELAEGSGLNVADVRQLSGDLHRVVISLDNWVETGNGDLPSGMDNDPEEHVLNQERVKCLLAAVHALPSRHQMVVRGYFLESRRMADIAQELDVSVARVSQICSDALVLLRDGMEIQLGQDKVTPLRAKSGQRSRRAAYRATLAQVG